MQRDRQFFSFARFFAVLMHFTRAQRSTASFDALFSPPVQKSTALKCFQLIAKAEVAGGNRTFPTDASGKHSGSVIIFARRTICA